MKLVESLYHLAFASGLHAVITFLLFFLCLYFGGVFMYKLVLYFQIKYGHFQRIQQNLKPGQIGKEIRHALVSIFVFSLQAIPLQYLIAIGIAKVSFENAWVLLWQIPIMFLWNEVHFYGMHWLLHRRWWMQRVHYVHHQSKEPTIYSIYSFHWAEAFLLGTVIFPPMCLYTFHMGAIASLPIMSVLLNLMGHSNHEPPTSRDPQSLGRFIFRHSMHHKWSNGNYGFMLPYLDALFKTKLPKTKN
jgi:lathosterol oxidase